MRGASQGLNLVDSVYERLLSERISILGSQVDDDIANRLCAQILLLAAEDPTKDIHLYINSPGGSISAGMAISDTMGLAPCHDATSQMGQPRGRIEAASDGDRWFTAPEALEYGFVDHIITSANINGSGPGAGLDK